MCPTDPHAFDDSNDRMQIGHEYDGDTPPSIAIVEAIAAIENVDPVDSPADLGITLYDHVDPAALDRLAVGNDGDDAVTIELTIHNEHQYAVEVRDAGDLVVEKEA